MGRTSLHNIGRYGTRRRAVAGVVGLAAGVGLTGALALLSVPWPAAGLGAPLFLGGAVGVFQARAGTCVYNAAHGVREDDAGVTCRVEDPGERTVLRRQARGVWARSILAAAALTAAAAGVLFLFG